MNEELTREALELMKRVDERFISESVVTCMGVPVDVMIKRLATALLAEMDKPKMWDGVIDWDSRPWANEIVIAYRSKEMPGDKIGDKIITIKRPKTRARQIAENLVHGITGVTNNETKDIEYVEGVLNKYAEELEGKS
jgi:hypothetical protein